MTPDIEAIEKRAKDATPGPWIEDSVHHKFRGAVAVKDPSTNSGFRRIAYIGSAGAPGPYRSNNQSQHELNCVFIAHAREDIPALIKRVKELEVECAQLQLKYTGKVQMRFEP